GNPEIPPTLEAICLRCLERPMSLRYRVAADLAAELRGWLSASGRRTEPGPVRPKGLKAFDFDDAPFFLSLLPGPRRGDGLPESVWFWKTRIERYHEDAEFRVGLIHGPSGAGKSSFLSAGLLPHLDRLHVRPVHIEATPTGTEARLRTKLYQLVMHLR